MKYKEAIAIELEKAGINSKIVEDNYTCGLLKGKYQRWFKLVPEIDLEVLQKLNKKIPFWGVIENEQLRIFDLGDDYKSKVINAELKYLWLYPQIRNLSLFSRNFKLYINYEILPGLEGRINEPIGKSPEFIQYYSPPSGVDYIIWVYRINLDSHRWINLPDLVSFIVYPQKFVPKGIFLSHQVDADSDALTLSFLVSFLRKFIEIWRKSGKKQQNFYIHRMVYDKISFLDVFEREIVALWLKNLGIPYEPLIGDKHIEKRIDYIYENLKAAINPE